VAVWDVPARLWTVARKIEDLLELQTKTREALEKLDGRLRAVEDRMTRLEAGQNN
jgi:prefoldin subunit 5